MLLKRALKAALYAGIAGAFVFGCVPLDEGGMLLEEGYDGVLVLENGLTAHSGAIPVGSCDIVSSITMGSVIITGGSATIAVRSRDLIDGLYIQFSNEPGVYYELPMNPNDYLDDADGVYLYAPYVYVSQESSVLVNNASVRVTLVVRSANCGPSRATNTNVTTQVVGSGSLQLALTWNTTSDVDLHVKLPDGKHAYFGNKLIRAANGDTLAHLDRDANISCRDNGAAENMYFRTLMNGLYLVYVRLYTNCSGADYNLTATAGGRILDYHYLDETRGSFSSNAYDGDDHIIGVLTVENGRLTTTDYDSPAVKALLLSTNLPKQLAAEAQLETK